MVIAFFAFLLVLGAAQAPAGPTPGEVEALKKLEFLVGDWKGVGTMAAGPGGGLRQFDGTERVQRKLHGKALLVEGHFVDPKTKETVHETLAVISFDEEAKKYRFKTYLFNRPGSGEYELHPTEKGFWWEIVTPGSPRVKFTMTLTDSGEWSEIGEVFLPGRDPMKFLDMRLKKTSSAAGLK